ncbi:hypothetical protein K493DRAFT_318692 [Basidiobolus meristosporus CBS 931.73]|uniref:Alpha N-terminal protein methyltransferase 1 n=1 Tax=Basidiobolus meristosporus CBS 931.73 TaxID=1314790 RepID=A0A1Y1XV96_9FUNG|nr:hypothetical protein K493DRAFT_318692 [Basidiobolus meristosporus CBS 931.73]|eukprot:ORX89416.1 hypothetical protein K493DRAFT_318692 [Basidiobolus meristosporus CBS 931.73]
MKKQFDTQDSWYDDAHEYWNNVTPTVNGMLGGYESISKIDVQGSQRFIEELVNGRKGAKGNVLSAPYIEKERACDCGAGIGRVTKHFLLNNFKTVDLVEQTAKFLEQAQEEYLLNEKEAGRIGEFICQGLQDFTPEEESYDLIWSQWVLGHLTDDDLVAFFERCKRGLKPRGLIGVKENIAVSGYIVDEEDSSVTRSEDILKGIFKKAGLRIIKEQTQMGFPSGLFTVKMFALVPESSEE